MLTKSDFLLYLEAPMHLWAMKNDRTIARPISAHEEFLRRQSAEVEHLAGQAVAALNPAPAVVVSQAPYTSGNFHARTDFLVSRTDGRYDLYEVKSATRVKPEHVIDAAFQALVILDQLPLAEIYILHIDNTYRRSGAIDPAEFFIRENITADVQAQLAAVDVSRQQALAAIDQPYEAVYDQKTKKPLLQGCHNPSTCPCPDLCFPPLPEYPVFQLPRLGKKAAELTAQGVYALADIPESFRLTDVQRKHIRAATGETQIDAEAIRQFLGQLQFPLHFLDYETFPAGIPAIDGYRPYEHAVFQFSLHTVPQADAAPQQDAFLHSEATDPAPLLADALSRLVHPEGSILAWNQSFEKARNRELADRLPAYANFFNHLNDRMIDLMDVFMKGFYVDREFRGSASLKSVLPVLVPDMTYANTSIRQGSEAMAAWQTLVFDPLPDSQKAQIEKDLLDYCHIDTEGMVRIWQTLVQLT